MRHHLGCVLVQMLPCCVVHHTLVELGCLRIIALLSFMCIVTLPRHDVVRYLIWRLGGVRAERMLEAVGYVRLIPSMVSIAAERAVKVETLVLPGHERAVDGDLVQIDTNAVILRVAIKKHAELEQRVRRVLNTRYQAARGKCGLFYITVIILRILVEYKTAELVHLKHLDTERSELGPATHTGN